MIDVHCHLNFHAFEKDVDAVIRAAHEKGVKTIINVGTKIDSSEKAVMLAKQYNNLYAIVGVHPHHADKHDLSSDWVKELERLGKQTKVVAIGEIGLDYYEYQSNGIVDPKLQKEIFEAQIVLAHTLHLPLQIHNRHAGKDILEILHAHKNLLKTDTPGMFHCFAGDMNTLKGALDLGFMIGFDGNITYPGLAPKETVTLSELAKATPLERIVTETDSPFLTPIPYRGSRNEPSYVIIVGQFLAKLKGVSFEEFEEQTTANAQKLFGIDIL
ncbi:MAG: TatD family hydrolase [Candidatus Levyibacteriota bacterium]